MEGHITLAKFSVFSRVTNWQVFCSYVHFNASHQSLVRIGADKRTTSVSPSVAWHWMRWNSRPTTCVCVCLHVCVDKQMWTVPHNLTTGEVVFTTYMLVVLFLERPALPSAPRPQTNSSCTALQLRKGSLHSKEKAHRLHTMLTQSTLLRTGCSYDSCALYTIH